MAWDTLKGVEGEGKQPLHDVNDDIEEVEANDSTPVGDKVLSNVAVANYTGTTLYIGSYYRSRCHDGAG